MGKTVKKNSVKKLKDVSTCIDERIIKENKRK